jgi:arsenate reductase
MPRLLFVCVHNAGRSVMAEAFARAAGMEAKSAGTIPQDHPHPEVVAAMEELDMSVSGHTGRVLTDEVVAWADRVITMGCAVDEAACPAIRYSVLEDWALDDPKGQPPEKVREIRDEIKRRVDQLAKTS